MRMNWEGSKEAVTSFTNPFLLQGPNFKILKIIIFFLYELVHRDGHMSILYPEIGYSEWYNFFTSL